MASEILPHTHSGIATGHFQPQHSADPPFMNPENQGGKKEWPDAEMD